MSKPLDRFTLLETFVRIADSGSISAAARDLGLTQPSVSRQLAELETRLKTQLIRRNTHSMALTDSGLELLSDARQLLDGWEALSEKHLNANNEIHGRLKVVAPVALGQRHLVQIACVFQKQHPQVTLTWELEDHAIRFAQSGCDCWIKVGPVPDDTLVVRRIGSAERQLVASKELVKSPPKSPKATEQLPLIALEPFEGGHVPLTKKSRTTTIRPPIQMRTNNIFAAKEAAIQGIGMAVLPTWFIADELRNGKLRNVLPGWTAPSLDIHMAYLPARHQPMRLRAFMELIDQKIPEIEGITKDA